jgi:hypothetical protein
MPNVPACCQRLPLGWRLRMPRVASDSARPTERSPRKCRRLVRPNPQAPKTSRSGSSITMTP